MPRTIRFHLDEHIAQVIAEGLRRRGIDVTTTSDANLNGADDLEVLSFALRERRVIFTNDVDFVRLHGLGHDHPGIVYCHQQSRSIGEIVGTLELLWELVEPDEIKNRIEFI